MTTKAVVLFSGGQDSTTALFWAARRFDELHALTIDYGQRHAAEVSAAEQIVARYSCADSWTRISMIDPFEKVGGGSLLEARKEAGGGARIEASGGIPDARAPEGLPTSFVPGRNLIFFSLAAALAVKVGAREVVSGVCQADYSGYPDCRQEFVHAFGAAATLAMPSSAGPLSVLAPLMNRTKRETVLLARDMSDCWEALALTVTCYEGERPGCGKCPACVLRAKGFAEAGEVDPARA